jgi:hypothetical protein
LGIFGSDIRSESYVNYAGVSNSFKLSIDFDKRWTETLDKVASKCTSHIAPKYPVPEPDSSAYIDYWDCFEKIPMYFYSIIDCAYDYN